MFLQQEDILKFLHQESSLPPNFTWKFRHSLARFGLEYSIILWCPCRKFAEKEDIEITYSDSEYDHYAKLKIAAVRITQKMLVHCKESHSRMPEIEAVEESAPLAIEEAVIDVEIVG